MSLPISVETREKTWLACERELKKACQERDEAIKLLRLVYLSEKFGPASKRMISDQIRDFLADKTTKSPA